MFPVIVRFFGSECRGIAGGDMIESSLQDCKGGCTMGMSVFWIASWYYGVFLSFHNKIVKKKQIFQED